jgi:hypothetical protein
MPLKTPIEITALEARRQLGDLMNRAYYGGERFVVKRDNLPMITIEPVYSKLERAQSRERFFAFMDQVRDQLALNDPDEVDKAFEEALAAARHRP